MLLSLGSVYFSLSHTHQQHQAKQEKHYQLILKSVTDKMPGFWKEEKS